MIIIRFVVFNNYDGPGKNKENKGDIGIVAGIQNERITDTLSQNSTTRRT